MSIAGPAVLVDPILGGRELARAFCARGVPCVAVLTTPAIARHPWSPQDFVAVLHHDGDIGSLARAVAEHAPLCIVAAFESGVEVADALVDLVLPGTGNEPGMSIAHRDKYRMATALRAAGVPHLRQVCSDRHEDVEEWIGEYGLENHPLVLKPPKSGGTDSVYLVAGGADWRPSFDRILGTVNALGVRNDAVLVQEFAAGAEYIVDTYSVDGRHGLVEVCRYKKYRRHDRLGVYDYIDFVAPHDPAVDVLFEYTQQALGALGIRNGAAHAEVMLTADGPILIEVGARPAGGAHQELSRLATGDSQHDRCVAHHVHGRFRTGYELRRQVRAVYLSCPRAGILRNAQILDRMDALAAFHSKQLSYGDGDVVPAGVDLMTTLGLVILAADDELQIRAACRVIKQLEAELRVEPAAARDDPPLTAAAG